MVNSGEVAVAKISTPGGRVSYAGEAEIAGVPGRHAAVPLLFQNIAGSMSGALFSTGNEMDVIDDVHATLIDNGMPCVVMRATDFGLSGTETREEIEANSVLKQRIEAIRLKAGPMMNLGDVTTASVLKMTLVRLRRTAVRFRRAVLFRIGFTRLSASLLQLPSQRRPDLPTAPQQRWSPRRRMVDT